MPSLKQLKALEAQPSLFGTSVQEAISNEDAYDIDDNELSAAEPTVDWYIPKKSYKQFFLERSGGKIEGGWDIPVFDSNLPKEIRLNAWTYITNVRDFVSSHLTIVKKYNGNKRFKPYLERLQKLELLINTK